MKRFFLFGGDCYYPAGGWDDFIEAFDTLDDARSSAERAPRDWWHIVDASTMQKIATSGDDLPAART